LGLIKKKKKITIFFGLLNFFWALLKNFLGLIKYFLGPYYLGALGKGLSRLPMEPALAMTHIASKKDQKWGGPATPFLGKGWLQPPRDFLFYFLFPFFFKKKKKTKN
jgi:hypothetical protein